MTSSMHETLRANVLALADAFKAAKTHSDGTLSLHATGGDSRLIPRLRDNQGSISARKYDDVVGWFVANWPDGARWPKQVARPDG